MMREILENTWALWYDKFTCNLWVAMEYHEV